MLVERCEVNRSVCGLVHGRAGWETATSPDRACSAPYARRGVPHARRVPQRERREHARPTPRAGWGDDVVNNVALASLQHETGAGVSRTGGKSREVWQRRAAARPGQGAIGV